MLSDAVKRAVAVLHSGRSSRRVRLATILVLFPNAAYTGATLCFRTLARALTCCTLP